MIFKAISVIDGWPTFEIKTDEILAKVKFGGGIEILDPATFITRQQVKWWKGVLLPALANDSGHSKGWWELKLKLTVLPDEFTPEVIPTKSGEKIWIYPSITSLSRNKMGELIEGAVGVCHGWGFSWVTLPDKEK